MVLAGVATDFCVQFTAQDAFLRDLEIVIARDGVASETALANRRALAYCETQLGARVRRSSRIDFASLRTRRTSPGARS